MVEGVSCVIREKNYIEPEMLDKVGGRIHAMRAKACTKAADTKPKSPSDGMTLLYICGLKTRIWM